MFKIVTPSWKQQSDFFSYPDIAIYNILTLSIRVYSNQLRNMYVKFLKIIINKIPPENVNIYLFYITHLSPFIY